MLLGAIKTQNKKEILLEEIKKPDVNSEEVLIKVKYCGVCGSDLHAYVNSKGYEFVKPPRILGHEISGEVQQVGKNCDPSIIGKKVIVESMHYCAKCENCLSGKYSICENNKVIGLHFDGGMAQYVKTKIKYVKEIPNSISSDIAALSEPMAVALHAVNKIKKINSSDHIFIQGPGIIGIFIGIICISKGAKVTLSGLENDYESRLSIGEKLGMSIHLADDNLTKNTDILFECSGSNYAFKSGFEKLKKGGEIVVVALYENPINIFLTTLVRNEWSINTSYGCNPEDYEDAFKILSSYKNEMKEIISIYDLTEINSAFHASLNKNVLKAMINV